MITKPIGIFGGSFDPIHNGHLNIAKQLYQQLYLQEVRFIPCQKAVLDKTIQASAQQRLTMLQLAIQNQTEFIIDERELNRATPSYTVDTLISLREELGSNIPFCLIIGSDSLENLTRWHRWQELIQLAHLIVVPRPNSSLPQQGKIAELVQQHQIDDVKLLGKNASGCLFIANLPPSSVSATQIRNQIAAGLNPQDLLPENVLKFIEQENLYKP